LGVGVWVWGDFKVIFMQMPRKDDDCDDDVAAAAVIDDGDIIMPTIFIVSSAMIYRQAYVTWPVEGCGGDGSLVDALDGADVADGGGGDGGDVGDGGCDCSCGCNDDDDGDDDDDCDDCNINCSFDSRSARVLLFPQRQQAAALVNIQIIR